MLSENSFAAIAHVFCGDIAGYYSYKSGPALVSYFNNYFGYEDIYQSGFPSRWYYVQSKLIHLMDTNRIDSFFDIILSKEYLIQEQGISTIQAAELSQEIFEKLNQIVSQDLYTLTRNGEQYHLVKKNDDLVKIGSGGFANVYKQKSTGLIIKKLKEDYLTEPGIRSRFKREYSITSSLKDTHGIIQVYSFDESDYSYTMEEAETTLEKYILNNELTDDIKINYIRQILYIMSEVHNKDVIHRDISPNNIFIISGMLKIADFGLGKDLRVFSSHQTFHTNAVGQYFYCAPEQFMLLKDGDKRSDVYSLGRVINFIMTKDPQNSHHLFRSVAEKSTNSNSVYRYNDASQLYSFFEKAVTYSAQAKSQERIANKIQCKEYDDEVENYIYMMNSEQISKAILANQPGFTEALFSFMKSSEDQAQHIIQSVEQSYQDVCYGSFEANDPFADFAAAVIKSDFPFVVKEIAASILHYIAWNVNRFHAQRLIENLISNGIEPLLEESLHG